MMWKPILSVALVIFVTVSMFLLVYGAAYLVVYKTIGWCEKIIAKLKDVPEEKRVRNKPGFDE